MKCFSIPKTSQYTCMMRNHVYGGGWVKHHQKVYILFWLHFYSRLSFLSKLIVTMYMLLFLNTSCTSLFEIWNVLSANLKWKIPQLTSWDEVAGKEQKLTKLPLDCLCVRGAQTWVPSAGNPYIHMYICVHTCVIAYYIFTYMCVSLPKPTILVQVSFAVMKYYD